MSELMQSQITVNQFLLGYAEMLLADIPDERLAEQLLPGVNHPAWILGHLANTADSAGSMLLGTTKQLPEEFSKKFGAGSILTSVRSDYPSLEELKGLLRESYTRFQGQIAAASEETLRGPTTHPRLRERLPVLQEALTFILVGHVGIHLGQLSSWRRMIGLPAMF